MAGSSFYRPTKLFVQHAQRMYPRAFTPWTPEEDKELRVAANKGLQLNELVAQFQRSPRSIVMRLDLFELKIQPSTPEKEPLVDDPKKEWPKEGPEDPQTDEPARSAP